MNADCIRDFIDKLPACLQVGELADLIFRFSQASPGGQVVVLDTFQRPVGIAKAQRWLPYFSALEQLGQSSQPLHLYPSRYGDGRAEKTDGVVGSSDTDINSHNRSLDQDPQEQTNQAASLHRIMAAVTLQTPIYEFIHRVYTETGQLMLDPVAIAPSYWSLDEFQHNLYQQNFSFSRCPLVEASEGEALQAESQQMMSRLLRTHQMAHPHMIRWVVVDECDRFLGAVDFGRIWQTLMPISAALSHSQAEAASLQHSTPAPPSASLSQSRDALLLETLDDLPLPVMIQTGDGEIVVQNQTWRSRMAELADAEGLWRQITHSLSDDVLSGDSTGTELKRQNTDQRHVVQRVDSGLFANSDVLSSPFDSLVDSPTLESEILNRNSQDVLPLKIGEASFGAIAPLHSQTDSSISCLCLCSLKTGQERVWQFHRVRMRSTSQNAPLHSEWRDITDSVASAVTHTEPGQDSHRPFSLAPLVSSEAIAHSLYREQHSQPLWLVHVQDVTEQRQALKELAARNADLAQASQLKNEFLACITHELKTPLTSILGLSGLMKDQSVGALNSRQQRYMQLIHYSGRRLVGIVNDILDLSRIESGQIQLNSTPTQIRQVCELAYKEARQIHLYSQNAELSPREEAQAKLDDETLLPSFHLDIQSGLKQVIADELRLRQVLSHLLSNALKFTPAGNQFGLQVSLWDNWITFTVWDTGIGIPTDKQHLIFQKFQQLENPMTRKFEGTGLGLVLAQKLAQLHGGDLTFTSTEGEGSQFTLLLPPRPLQPEEAWAMNPIASPMLFPSVESSGSGDRPGVLHSQVNRLIVIVEADRQLIEHLVKQVTSLGYRAVIARSGTEAIGKVRRLQPRIVLLNSVLPLLSGWDVLTLLKADALTRHIPVVAMASPLESAKAKENNVDGILTHPIQPNEIQREIHRVLEPNESSKPLDSLTVLYLNPEPLAFAAVEPMLPDDVTHDASIVPKPEAIALNTQTLNTLLQPYRCRVIEVDDLDQAELLSRVWHPDVILLGEPFPQPEEMLKSLSQRLNLAELPIVTLSRATTQAANQSKRLKVFPCFDPMQVPTASDPTYEFGLSSLLQVIQIATGIQWVPHIVVTHSDYLLHPDVAQVYDPEFEFKERLTVKPRLQATRQYLQTAGLRSSVNARFSDITQQIGRKNVDVLLLCGQVSESNLDSLLLQLEMLVRLDPLMPVLIWLDEGFEPHSEGETNRFHHSNFDLTHIEATLKTWATDVLPATAAVNDVFIAVNSAIARRIHLRGGL